MKVAPGFCALVTGAGTGIGRALAVTLASQGATVSVVDFVQESGLETLELVAKEHEKLGLVQAKPPGIFVKCDVSNPAEVKAAFAKHGGVFGALDVCINCAGTPEHGDFLGDDEGRWRRVIDVNLNGVIECTRHAVELMRHGGKPGVIVNVGSAGGIVPNYLVPIYCTSKAGVIMFTLSLSNLRKEGIRVNVVCPEYVQTAMIKELPKEMIELAGGFVSMDQIVTGTFLLIEDDENAAGDCLYISATKGLIYPPKPY